MFIYIGRTLIYTGTPNIELWGVTGALYPEVYIPELVRKFYSSHFQLISEKERIEFWREQGDILGSMAF